MILTPKLKLPRPEENDNHNLANQQALVDAIDANAVPKSEKGIPLGIATLGADGKVPVSQLSIAAPPDATTTTKGIVKLNDSTESTSVLEAATANAVRKVAEASATHQAEDAIDAHNASNISVLDTAGLFVASDVEGALKESIQKANSAFQSASDGKTAVASAVTAKGVAASPSDTFPTLATKIGQISTGKKFATGTIVSSSSKESFVSGNGGAYSAYSVTVTGLTFLPSYILVYHIGDTTVTAYMNDFNGYEGATNADNDIHVSSSFPITSRVIRKAGNASVSSSGFKLPVAGDFTNAVSFKWVAYE